MIELALSRIRGAAAEGSLLHHQDLVYILYRWRDLAGSATEVRAWTEKLLARDDALVVLAQAFTGETWSQGMGMFGSLGDRVAMRDIRAQINDTTDIVNVGSFREALERLLGRADATLNDQERSIVVEFLAAWDRRRAGED